jgi:predicted phosphodiesterase
MIKIAYASDLHLEMNSKAIDLPHGLDVVVLCGDLTVGGPSVIEKVKLIQSLVMCPLVFVLGNHEFYDGVPVQDTIKQVRNAFAYNPDIHFLENNMVEILGVNFIGGTLWTDFKVDNDMQATAQHVARGMNDHRLIKVKTATGVVNMSNIFWLQKHDFTRKFIEHAVEDSKLPTVVVTHHGGHVKVNGAAAFKQSLMRGGFVSDIQEIRPDIWLSGHTHEQMHFIDNGTLFATNCYGYEKYEPALVDDFVWKFVEV